MTDQGEGKHYQLQGSATGDPKLIVEEKGRILELTSKKYKIRFCNFANRNNCECSEAGELKMGRIDFDQVI